MSTLSPRIVLSAGLLAFAAASDMPAALGQESQGPAGAPGSPAPESSPANLDGQATAGQAAGGKPAPKKKHRKGRHKKKPAPTPDARSQESTAPANAAGPAPAGG